MSDADARIAEATRSCYERCSKAEVPATCVAAFVLRLQDDQGWSKEDAEKAGRLVIQMIRNPPTP
jgi:hypothetical protein